MITITVDELKAKFPADELIQSRDDAAVQSAIDAVMIESGGGYDGILDDNTRLQAIALHVAHTIRIELITGSSIGAYGMPTAVKSKDEEIRYSSGERMLDFTSTLYGQRLQKLLDSQYLGGFLI